MNNIKVGDEVKMLVDKAEMAEVSKGDILIVTKVTNGGVAAKKYGGLTSWCFDKETMGEEWDIYNEECDTNNRSIIPGSIDDIISRY